MSSVYTNPPKNEPTRADAIVGGLLGWIFVFIGSAAIAAGALIPAYLDTLDTREQVALIREQADVLRAERDRYVDFQAALEADEPVLLERLAFTQLRLKPIGTETADLRPTDPAAVIDSPDPDAIRQVTMNWQSAQPIEYWLSRPQLAPDAQATTPIVRPRETRLIRAVTGNNRIWVAAFGALLLIVGLWPRRTPAA